YAVIEMGANHIGEIAHLASLAEPTVGIVTNAGAAHLEGFGSLAGVAQGKGEMFCALPPEGVAVINADDTYVAQWRDSSAADRVLTFGFEQPADFMAHKVRSQSDASGFRTDFELVTPYGSKSATLVLGGLHNLRNALGAAAAACAAGVERRVPGRRLVQRQPQLAQSRPRCIPYVRRRALAGARRDARARRQRRRAARRGRPLREASRYRALARSGRGLALRSRSLRTGRA